MTKPATDRGPVAPPALHPSWWRLGATASLRTAKKRGWRPDDGFGNAQWIGRDWNGHSNIKLGLEDNNPRNAGAPPRYHTITAEAATSILKTLRDGIVACSVQVTRLPDHKSVRCVQYQNFQSATLVIDIDFGEFIFPIEMNADLLANHPDLTPMEVGVGMMEAVLGVHAIRDEMAATERLFRSAFQQQAQIADVVPLWFRKVPWRFDVRYKRPLSTAYDMAVLMLDEDLLPLLVYRSTGSVADIELYLGFHGTTQRRRATNRSKLAATGSAGLVTEVALGLIQARGMEPRKVLDSLRASRLTGNYDGLVHRTDTTREILTFAEGILDTTIEFKGGNYAAGKLTLNGDFPHALVMAAKRRPMTAFVDHPAFRAAGTMIRQARVLRGCLRLYHMVQSMPIEDAAAQIRNNAKRGS